MRVRSFFEYCRAFYPDWQAAELEDLTRLFQLPPDRRLRDLSRGMRMKAQLAAALAYKPRLLILDEPFGGLDVLVREQLMECISERTPESTVLIATHDLSDIESFATHVAYLAGGRIQFAEEMDGLSARFREIEAVVPLAAELPERLPANWLNLSRAAGVVRFTDAQYEERRCTADLQESWPGVRNVSVRALSLRSIFIALARRRNSEQQPCD
jgi:ABC-2 type transport system ATP-binding protein